MCVCVHMCMGLRVTASCSGQSLHLSACLPDSVEPLQGRLAATSGHIFSGVAKAKCSLFGWHVDDATDCHFEAVPFVVDRFKDDGS